MAAAKCMIKADLWKNRLYLVLQGFFSDEEAKEVADKTIQEIRKLKPGFDIINDISNYKPMSQRGADEIKRAQIVAFQCGVGRVIRVVPTTTIGAMQFARKSKEVGYDAELAPSIEEAENMLAESWRQSRAYGR
jgi:hypothetical protein